MEVAQLSVAHSVIIYALRVLSISAKMYDLEWPVKRFKVLWQTFVKFVHLMWPCELLLKIHQTKLSVSIAIYSSIAQFPCISTAFDLVGLCVNFKPQLTLDMAGVIYVPILSKEDSVEVNSAQNNVIKTTSKPRQLRTDRRGILCPLHTADSDATQLSSCVASAVWTQFGTSSRRLPTDSVDNLENDQTDSIAFDHTDFHIYW